MTDCLLLCTSFVGVESWISSHSTLLQVGVSLVFLLLFFPLFFISLNSPYIRLLCVFLLRFVGSFLMFVLQPFAFPASCFFPFSSFIPLLPLPYCQISACLSLIQYPFHSSLYHNSFLRFPSFVYRTRIVQMSLELKLEASWA